MQNPKIPQRMLDFCPTLIQKEEVPIRQDGIGAVYFVPRPRILKDTRGIPRDVCEAVFGYMKPGEVFVIVHEDVAARL